MSVRLRPLVAAGCIGLGAAIAACSGGSTAPNGGGSGSTVTGEYVGELSGAGLTGVLDVTFSSGTSATSNVRVLDTADLETATGTLTLPGGASIALAGTFDPDTGALSIAGGGYSFDGTLRGDGVTGTFSSPGGSGSFSLLKGGGGAQLFCGTYSGQDAGVWNLVVAPSSAAGSIASDVGSASSALTCTVSGASLSCQSASGIVASGTINGTTASGQWHDGNGNGGSWSGDTGKCPVPRPHKDAGAPDATASDDAGSPPDAAIAVDTGSAEDAGSATDAGSAQDTGTAHDAGGGTDAASGSDSASASDSSTETDSASASDSSTGTDSASASDSSTGTDSSSATDSGGSLDAGSTTTDSGPTDAAVACPYTANITSVTPFPVGPSTTALTQLGMGTGNYPIQILTNAAVCPGGSVVQVSTGSLWTDIGMCQGNGAGPDSTCDGVVIPSTSLATPAQVQLRVVNPGQPAGTAYSFYIFQGAPAPVVTGPATASLVAGGGVQQILLSGTGLSGTKVECDFVGDGGVAVVPTVLQSTNGFLQIQFPAAFTATAQPLFWTKVTQSNPVGGIAYWDVQIGVH
jgi:hypothetical protein